MKIKIHPILFIVLSLCLAIGGLAMFLNGAASAAPQAAKGAVRAAPASIFLPGEQDFPTWPPLPANLPPAPPVPALNGTAGNQLTRLPDLQSTMNRTPLLDSLKKTRQPVRQTSAFQPTVQGILATFSSRQEFNQAVPGQTLADFESGGVPAEGIASCDAPLTTAGGTCFPPGGIPAGLIIQDNPGPSPDGLYLVGAYFSGVFKNQSKILLTQDINESMDLVFTSTVYAVGLDVFQFSGGPQGPVEITVYGPGDVLLGSSVVTAETDGTFWGVITNSPITRINLNSLAFEGADNIAFGDASGVFITKNANVDFVSLGERITYTLKVFNYLTTTLTGGAIQDTLPKALIFAGPITLDPPGAGVPGSTPPTLAQDITLASKTVLTVTLPVTVSNEAYGGQQIINNASLTYNQSTQPATASSVFTIADCRAQVDGFTTVYTNTQAAVDAAADGDLVKISGYCMGGAADRAGYTQMAYITKTLTLQGGYAPDFGVWNPQTYPTTLNAESEGRVFLVAGQSITQTIAVTITDLTLLNGSAFGPSDELLVGEPGGGNLFAKYATLVMQRNVIQNGFGPFNGGAFLFNTTATLSDNLFKGNNGLYAGGFASEVSTPTLRLNTFTANSSSQFGAGLLSIMDFKLVSEQNTYQNNRSSKYGGGAVVIYSPATFTDDVFTENAAMAGGGFVIAAAPFTATRLTVSDNTGSDYGGGVYFEQNLGTAIISSTFENNRGGSVGGAIFLNNATAFTMTNSTVFSNTADMGGGLTLFTLKGLLENNNITNNSAGDAGGGLFVGGGELRTRGNQIYANSAQYGGGYYFNGANWYSEPFIDPVLGKVPDSVGRNNATYNGAGIFMAGNNAKLIGAGIYENNVITLTGAGGGLFSENASLVMTATQIAGNNAPSGGGIYLLEGAALLDNNLLALNTGVQGTQLAIDSSSPRLRHSTFDSLDAAILVTGTASSPTFSNTILSNEGLDLNVLPGNQATLDSTLWGSSQDVLGAVASTHDFLGEARFLAPEQGDYHLTFASPAINAGQPAGVADDFEGQLRDAQPDLGMDEFSAFTNLWIKKWASAMDAAPGDPITFFVRFGNSGSVTATNITVSDLIPPSIQEVSFSSATPLTTTGSFSYTWQAPDLPNQGVVTIIVNGRLALPLAAGIIKNTATITNSGTVVDRSLLDNEYTTRVNVLDVGPQAGADLYDVAEDTPTVLHVLANDTDSNGDPLSLVKITSPVHGAAEIVENTVLYTPTANYNGPDGFVYEASSSGGVTTATVQINVTPVNDNPVVNAGQDQTVLEGAPVQFTGSFIDPGQLRQAAATVGIRWNFGDGSTASGVLTPTHTFGDNGLFNVTLTITDALGGVGVDSLAVTVNNVAPSLAPLQDASAVTGQPFSLNLSFVDPGFLDTHTINITWAAGVTETFNLNAGVLTFQRSHTYTLPGNYTVTVTLRDDDGGEVTRTFQIVVAQKVFLPVLMRP